MSTINDSVVSAPEKAASVRAGEDAEPVVTEAVETEGREVTELQSRRVNHKPRYRLLKILDIQKSNYKKFYIVKLGEQFKLQVNPYALISKIEEITSRAS